MTLFPPLLMVVSLSGVVEYVPLSPLEDVVVMWLVMLVLLVLLVSSLDWSLMTGVEERLDTTVTD